MKMKRLFENVLRRLLTEEKCPGCGDMKAYVGMRDVECPNKKCKFFSQRQYDDVHVANGNDKRKAAILAKILRYYGLVGADSEAEPGLYDVLQEKYGFSDVGSDMPVAVNPDNWRAVPGRAKGVILAGHYDEIYWEPISSEAKQFVDELNDPAINDRLANPDQYAGNTSDDAEFKVGHLYDGRISDCPSWIPVPTDEEVREVFGFGRDESVDGDF